MDDPMSTLLMLYRSMYFLLALWEVVLILSLIIGAALPKAILHLKIILDSIPLLFIVYKYAE